MLPYFIYLLHAAKPTPVYMCDNLYTSADCSRFCTSLRLLVHNQHRMLPPPCWINWIKVFVNELPFSIGKYINFVRFITSYYILMLDYVHWVVLQFC